jgi:thiol-disulfide isomerase/thioredoxin
MNGKRVAITFTVILAVVVALGIYVAMLFPATSNNSKPVATKNNSNIPQSATPTAASKKPGTYQVYSDTAYEAGSDSRRILFFHAPWCPQCRQLDKEITASKLPDGVAIFKVDYDTSQKQRITYGVTLQTTFVEVDSKGSKVKSIVAYNEPTYANLVKQLSL